MRRRPVLCIGSSTARSHFVLRAGRYDNFLSTGPLLPASGVSSCPFISKEKIRVSARYARTITPMWKPIILFPVALHDGGGIWATISNDIECRCARERALLIEIEGTSEWREKMYVYIRERRIRGALCILDFPKISAISSDGLSDSDAWPRILKKNDRERTGYY